MYPFGLSIFVLSSEQDNDFLIDRMPVCKEENHITERATGNYFIIIRKERERIENPNKIMQNVRKRKRLTHASFDSSKRPMEIMIIST